MLEMISAIEAVKELERMEAKVRPRDTRKEGKNQVPVEHKHASINEKQAIKKI
jgi:hypothetical protein